MSDFVRRSALCVTGHDETYMFLTSIRDWIYHFFVMGDVVAKLNGT